MLLFWEMSFSQISLCTENINITTPITTNRNLQVSNTITASSLINPNLDVKFRATQIILKPGFNVKGQSTGNFRAYVDPCSNKSPKDFFDKTSSDITEIKQPIISPNPAKSFVFVDNVDDLIGWSLFDLYGQEIISGDIKSYDTKIEINISKFTPGVYYFVGKLKNGELFQTKIIKN